MTTKGWEVSVPSCQSLIPTDSRGALRLLRRCGNQGGARSSDPDVNWNSDWNWEVKGEVRDDIHGLVYKVDMEHEEIGRCYGYAQFSDD